MKLKVCILVISNLLLSIFLGGFLTIYVQDALVQLIFPVICIILTLITTRSLVWAPLLAFLSGQLFTISYSLSSFNEIILHSSLINFFYNAGFISAFSTFLIILTQKSRKKEYTWL
jgi:hypothetical protein